MSKTVTVRRGEKLPENMVGGPFVVPVTIEVVVEPGSIYPKNARADSITVEVHNDTPPQAYLIVPCEPGRGTHWREQDDAQLWGCSKASAFDSTHKQIPCALTLEDLRRIQGRLVGTEPRLSSVTFELFGRLTATIAAWSAVPQAKEAGK